MKILVLANIIHTNTFTGGDKIMVECAKKWVLWGHDVTVITNEAGRAYCLERDLPSANIKLWPATWADRYGVYVAMITKAIVGFWGGLFVRTKPDLIFASSFFLPDMLPAFFVALRNPDAKLNTACYLFTTKKWGSNYSGGRLKGFLFYLNEQIAFWLVKKVNGKFITASEFDRHEFIRSEHFPAKRVLALRGGVDSSFFRAVPKRKILYDAVFLGRFHPQKCIPELIGMWQSIIARDPSYVLALVGSGQQEDELKNLVARKKLQNNIFFLGARDGEQKTKILKASRIFLSASRYDSGNIALDEALACGVPGIVYDLPRLWYPQGVIRISVGKQQEFINAIDELLKNEKKHKRLSEDALAFAQTLDWKKKAKELLTFMSRA